MFSVGDLVSYPMHGVGVVEAIDEQHILGGVGVYYSLRFVNGKMTALVPVATAEQVGLRPLTSEQDCKKIIDYMRSDGDRGSDNWNQRYRENLEKLRTGTIINIADVVKCLELRESEKKLSSGEKKMLVMAKAMLLCEIATVLKSDPAEIEPLLG